MAVLAFADSSALSEQRDDPTIAAISVLVMTARGALEPGAIDVSDVL
jgi:hypothetical protein